MPEVILHHYPLSLFAEKIRCLLACKRVPWRSVVQPDMMPKPDLTPLTGGYRRIPVMQVGADVYCDTACIARRLEELFPDPPCIPLHLAGEVAMIEEWADHRFTGQCVPSVVVELLPHLPEGILDDRAAMSPMLSKQAIFQMAPHAWAQSLLSMDILEKRLRDRAWLAGDAFTLADAACYHPLWFVRRVPKLYEAVLARPALAAWMDRIAAFGAGDATAMDSAEALAIGKASHPADVHGGGGSAGSGISPGDTVAIRADDFGTEVTGGTVVRITGDEITILREDATLGEIAVHFPRSGYVVIPQAATRAA